MWSASYVVGRRRATFASSTAVAKVEELVDDVPDELEHLGGSDEGRADPQTELAANVADQRRHLVLGTFAGHEHLSTVATPGD